MFTALNTENMEMPFSVEAKTTDSEIKEAVKVYIDLAKEYAESELQEKLEAATYPRFGYTTADVFENEAEYEAFLRELLAEEAAEYEEKMFSMIKTASDAIVEITVQTAGTDFTVSGASFRFYSDSLWANGGDHDDLHIRQINTNDALEIKIKITPADVQEAVEYAEYLAE